MYPLKALALLVSLGFCQVKASATIIADFETSVTCTITSDKNVTSASVSRTMVPNASQATRFTANLTGPDAGWAGISFGLTTGTLAAGTDHIALDARSELRTRSLFLTLTEHDESRWNANIPLTGDWDHYTIPLYHFRWFSGPETRRRSRPKPADLKSLNLWVGNNFQGANGFQVDNLSAEDRVSSLSLRLTSPNKIIQQKATTLTLEAVDATSETSSFSGRVWLEVPNRADAILPRTIDFHNGRAEFEVFPRTEGILELHAYEPVTAQDQSTSLTVAPAPLHVHLETTPFQDEQVIYVNTALAPSLTLRGDAVPLSVHIEVLNHQARRVFSSFFSTADLHNGHGKLIVPEPGLMQVRVRAIAEPIGSLPHITENMPVRVFDFPTTASTVQLPDGITTQAMMGYQITLEDLPSTATVLGEDRYSLLSLTETPREIYFNKWFYGIAGGALFQLDYDDHPTTGDRRVKWQRKLSAGWGRDDLFWHKIQPDQFSWGWQMAGDVIKRYRSNRVRLLGILDYEAAWSPGKSPADDQARKQWESFVRRLNEDSKQQVYAYEVWNEPNSGFWKPAPDVNAYRDLVKSTWKAIRTSGTQEIPGPWIVAGATAGFDPVFLASLLEKEYHKFFDILSFHAYPQSLSSSPDENALPEIIEEARKLLASRGLEKQLWITETGWPTAPGGVTEQEQANFLARAMVISMHKGLDKFFWFNLFDWTTWYNNDDFGAHTGLLDANYHPKPSAAAYNLATFLLPFVTPREQTTQGKATIYSFDLERQSTKFGGRIHVAWTPKQGDDQQIKVPIGSGNVFALDYLGAEQPAYVVDEETTTTLSDDLPTTRTYQFRASHEPLYIWDALLPRPVRKAAK